MNGFLELTSERLFPWHWTHINSYWPRWGRILFPVNKLGQLREYQFRMQIICKNTWNKISGLFNVWPGDVFSRLWFLLYHHHCYELSHRLKRPLEPLNQRSCRGHSKLRPIEISSWWNWKNNFHFKKRDISLPLN